MLVSTLVWLVLGYAFYCWVYAAAGSMAERQDQVQSLAFPLSLPIIFGYIVAAHRGRLGQRVDLLVQGPRLPAADRPVRHAGPGGPRPGHLVAVRRSAAVSIACTFAVAALRRRHLPQSHPAHRPAGPLREVLSRAGA